MFPNTNKKLPTTQSLCEPKLSTTISKITPKKSLKRRTYNKRRRRFSSRECDCADMVMHNCRIAVEGNAASRQRIATKCTASSSASLLSSSADHSASQCSKQCITQCIPSECTSSAALAVGQQKHLQNCVTKIQMSKTSL